MDDDPAMEVAIRSLGRLALFNEYSKQNLLKREDICRLCLPDHPRRFNELIAKGNAVLNDKLGMSLVPVPTNSRRPHSSAQTGNARKLAVRKKLKPPTIAGYALVSTLTPEERAKVAPYRHSKPLELALLSIVLVFIKLSDEQRIDVSDLSRQLSQLGLDRLTELPLRDMLDRWTRQKYVYTMREGEEDQVFVLCGGRAMVEFPNDELVQFVADLSYSAGTPEDGSEDGIGRQTIVSRLSAAFTDC